MEAVFLPEIFRIFSDDFRPVPAGKHGKLTRIHRKKSNKFPVGILLPLPAISVAFPQDPVTFPLLSCRILWDPVAVIFDMGPINYSIIRHTSCEWEWGWNTDTGRMAEWRWGRNTYEVGLWEWKFLSRMKCVICASILVCMRQDIVCCGKAE